MQFVVKSMALAAGIVLLSPGASAQKISAGAVGGASLTDAFRDLTTFEFAPAAEPGGPARLEGFRSWSPSKDFVAGAMLEVGFNPHWSVEVNGLFRQLNGKWAVVNPDGSLNIISSSSVVTWEFPVLAKYRFQGRRVNPFIEAGPSFRTTGNLNSRPSHHGIAAGAGLEMRWRSLKIAPAVRYTLWAGEKHTGGAQTAPDQVEILVGISRGSEADWRPLGRRIRLGFTLGTNLTGDIRTRDIAHEGQTPVYVSSGPRSFIYGPAVEVGVARRFSVEATALHRPISGATEMRLAEGRPYQWTFRAATWVFPVLAKYRLAVRGRTPFIALGPSFRLRQSFSDSSPYGIAGAAGLEMRAGPLKIAPAIRYTHWGPDRRSNGGPVRNQAEALVGLSF